MEGTLYRIGSLKNPKMSAVNSRLAKIIEEKHCHLHSNYKVAESNPSQEESRGREKEEGGDGRRGRKGRGGKKRAEVCTREVVCRREVCRRDV